MEKIKEITDDYTPEQLEDIKKLLELYKRVPTEKRELFMMTLCAYMDGIQLGDVYHCKDD